MIRKMSFHQSKYIKNYVGPINNFGLFGVS